MEGPGARLVSSGDTCAAIEVGLTAVSAAPTARDRAACADRSAPRRWQGYLSEAVRQYRSFAVLLGSELGVAPTPQLATALVGANVSAPRRIARPRG